MNEMTKSATAGSKRVMLRLLSRQVLSSGGIASKFGVACPRRGHYAPLNACIQCEACDGIRVGETQADNAVFCLVSADEAGADSVPSSGPRARAGEVAVAEIMTPHVLCVRAELGAEAVGRVLLEKGLGGAPVVDAMGRPIGIVSRTDVLRWATQERASLPAATVADVMTPVTFSLPANETVAKAAALMVFEHVHRLPVLAPSGEVIGIVSSHDVMRWLARSSGYVVDGLVYR